MSLYQEYDGSEDLKNLRVEVVRLKADRDEWRQKYWNAHDDFHRLWLDYSNALDAQPWATDEPIRIQLDRVTERLAKAENEVARLYNRVQRGEGSEDCPICKRIPMDGSNQQCPMCHLCQLESDQGRDREAAREAQEEVRRQNTENADLFRSVLQLKQILSDIHTFAHCTAKAGPLNTPDLQDAWSKFMQISVMATNGLVSTQPKRESNWKS